MKTYTLIRDRRTEDATLGTILTPENLTLYTLEPATPIPCGTYRLIVTWSPKFRRVMPLLSNVPGHEGIRIHWGNTSKDTTDCILVGLSRTYDAIQSSRIAFNEIYVAIHGDTLTEGAEITITEQLRQAA